MPDREEVLNPHLENLGPGGKAAQLWVIPWPEIAEDVLVSDAQVFCELPLGKLLFFEYLG